MKIPLYFCFIFQRLLLIFILIYVSLLLGYFCLDVFAFNSLPNYKKLWWHFLSLTLLKSDLFLTLSFILAAIHTLQSSKQHGEFVALQVGGISKMRLALPYFALSLLLTLLSYANVEFGIPIARSWEYSHKIKHPLSSPFEIKHLTDHSRIIYQKNGTSLFDLYWIRSNQEIWHCKQISSENGLLIGHFVDQLKRNPSRQFEKSASFPEYQLPFTWDDGKEVSFSPKSTPFSKMFQILTSDSLAISSDRAQFLTLFLYDLIHPWFPFLFLTGIFAFFLPLRISSSFLPFLIGIFFYLFFYSMTKTFTILGENYLVSPWVTLLLVPLGIQGAFVYKLCRH